MAGVTSVAAILLLALLAVSSNQFRPQAASAVVLVSEVAAPTSVDPPDPLSEISGDTQPDLQAEPSTGRLRFVYFVEVGEAFDPWSESRIERQAEALQQFWFDQFGGTFFLPADGVDVVYGDYTVEWYDTTINGDDARWYRLLNMQSEVRQALGITEADDVRMVVYPSARLDGRVGANRYDGAWMDGDDLTCIDGDIATIPYSSQFPANCLTTVAHELGHVYGLGHDGNDADCMQLGFYYYIIADSFCSFPDAQRLQVQTDVRNLGWLDAKPDERR